MVNTPHTVSLSPFFFMCMYIPYSNTDFNNTLSLSHTHTHTHLSSLNDLSEFIKVTSSGLSVEVPEGDYDSLVGVMHHLLAVKDRQPTTDGMFEPLNQAIELLKTYHEEMPELVYQQLEVSVCVCVCVCVHVLVSNLLAGLAQ